MWTADVREGITKIGFYRNTWFCPGVDDGFDRMDASNEMPRYFSGQRLRTFLHLVKNSRWITGFPIPVYERTQQRNNTTSHLCLSDAALADELPGEIIGAVYVVFFGCSTSQALAAINSLAFTKKSTVALNGILLGSIDGPSIQILMISE